MTAVAMEVDMMVPVGAEEDREATTGTEAAAAAAAAADGVLAPAAAVAVVVGGGLGLTVVVVDGVRARRLEAVAEGGVQGRMVVVAGMKAEAMLVHGTLVVVVVVVVEEAEAVATRRTGARVLVQAMLARLALTTGRLQVEDMPAEDIRVVIQVRGDGKG